MKKIICFNIMKIFYGIKDNLKDVTKIAIEKYMKNNIIEIPINKIKRKYAFGKVYETSIIKVVYNDGTEKIFNNNVKIVLFIDKNDELYYKNSNNKKLFISLGKKLDNKKLDLIYKIFDKLHVDLCFYLNLKNSDGFDYINKKTNLLSIFLKGSKLSLNNSVNNLFISKTIYSLHTKYTKFKNLSNNDFNNISSKYIKYNSNINYNKNGYILFYMNNIDGWYKNYIHIDNLSILIKNIREYVNNKIIIRLHPKNINNLNYINLLNNIIIKYKNIIIDNTMLWNEIISNCYCVFIQNAFIIFELLSYGIPLFNFDEIIDINYYSDVYTPINYINKIEKYNINRKDILKKYYSEIFVIDNKNTIENIIYNFINYDLKCYI